MGTSLAVQWLEVFPFTAEGVGSIPGQGTKIPQAAHVAKKKKKKSVGSCYLPTYGLYMAFRAETSELPAMPRCVHAPVPTSSGSSPTLPHWPCPPSNSTLLPRGLGTRYFLCQILRG